MRTLSRLISFRNHQEISHSDRLCAKPVERRCDTGVDDPNLHAGSFPDTECCDVELFAHESDIQSMLFLYPGRY